MTTGDERRVLMVTDGLGGGGAERQLALLSTSLREPWRAEVFALGGGPFAGRLRAAGVPLTLVPRRFKADPAPFVALARRIAAAPPAVVHSWGHMGCLAAELVCRPRRIAHVAGVVRRGSVHSWRGHLPRLASRLGHLVLANSQAGLDAFGVAPERGRVLHNGFDPARLARAAVPARGDGTFHVVMAATVDDRKDFATLLAAVRRLRERLDRPVRVTALGDGPGLEALRAGAADLLADGTASLPGRVDEILDHLGDAHVGALLGVPGWGEGISNSIMEYMAAGLPVVATDAGGNPELVVDGGTGLLVPAGDVEAVAAALARLASDPAGAADMGRAGRRRLETAFSTDAMTTRAAEIYAEAMALARR